jgi:hypothetical protein
MVFLDTFTRGPIATTCPPARIPICLPKPKFHPSRHLTPKFQIPFRIVPEKGSADPVSIRQSDLPALKINAELPFKGLPSQLTLIIYNLTLAFQLPPQMLNNYVPYGKIIKAPFSRQPLKMLPGFPVSIPRIVFLIASPKFPASFDTYFENF